MLTGEQIRAARALARMDQAGLAGVSGVSAPTIKRLERMVGPIAANTRTEAAIRKAFEEVGVVFIDPDAQGPGVRLTKPSP
jgi:transcriptional regulator with XRE-family HTH domain